MNEENMRDLALIYMKESARYLNKNIRQDDYLHFQQSQFCEAEKTAVSLEEFIKQINALIEFIDKLKDWSTNCLLGFCDEFKRVLLSIVRKKLK